MLNYHSYTTRDSTFLLVDVLHVTIASSSSTWDLLEWRLTTFRHDLTFSWCKERRESTIVSVPLIIIKTPIVRCFNGVINKSGVTFQCSVPAFVVLKFMFVQDTRGGGNLFSRDLPNLLQTICVNTAALIIFSVLQSLITRMIGKRTWEIIST